MISAGKTTLRLCFLWVGLMGLGWLGLSGGPSGLIAAPPTFSQEQVGRVIPSPRFLVSLTSSQPTPAYTPTVQRLERGLIEHGDRSRPLIALTFDACESPDQVTGYDEAVINILTDTGTPATLFLGGLWLRHHSRQAQALAANPLFELGNHSWSHLDFTRLHLADMNAEIERTQQVLAQLIGHQPTLFRFPAGMYTPEALAVVNQHGLQAIQWDVASGDADSHLTTQAIVKEVVRRARSGSIVVMHMNGSGRHTAEVLPAIIRQLRERGYTLVTVSQLLAGEAKSAE